MIAVLAFDLGSTAGWACRTRTGAVLHGTWTNKASRFDGGGVRYLRWQAWLAELPATLAIDRVVYEEVRNHKGVTAAHVYGGLMAGLTSWCEQQHIPYEGVPVQTIKKHATGAGNAGKDAVKAAVTRMGHTFADDNEADALALLDFACTALLTAAEGAGTIAVTPRRPRVRVRHGG